MTYKRIEYDPHAARRMREREFTRSEVRWLLHHGEREALPTQFGEQRWGRRGWIRGKEALLVYLENAERIYVLTVQYIY